MPTVVPMVPLLLMVAASHVLALSDEMLRDEVSLIQSEHKLSRRQSNAAKPAMKLALIDHTPQDPTILSEQGEAIESQKIRDKRDHDLVFMHIPHNFGHAVEFAHLLPQAMDGFRIPEDGLVTEMYSPLNESMIESVRFNEPRSEAWGHLNPELLAMSEVTGLPLYMTPQKYWPVDVAERYFGNKTVFGLLRDPYERFVSFFRSGLASEPVWGPLKDVWELFYKSCDVNAVVKMMTQGAIARGPDHEPWEYAVTLVQQSHYFDGPYGITVPIDARRFPASMNEAFEAHGYSARIKTQNVARVTGCENVWAGDLDAETKSLLRLMLKRDFELLCEHFGYCDDEENVCLEEVETMCPRQLFQWDSARMQYFRSTQ